MPMHPSPMADTDKLLFPSIRRCILVPLCGIVAGLYPCYGASTSTRSVSIWMSFDTFRKRSWSTCIAWCADSRIEEPNEVGDETGDGGDPAERLKECGERHAIRLTLPELLLDHLDVGQQVFSLRS